MLDLVQDVSDQDVEVQNDIADSRWDWVFELGRKLGLWWLALVHAGWHARHHRAAAASTHHATPGLVLACLSQREEGI